ncbi:hypothetical protein [Streptomyces sparsogenes]|uniref:DUF4352 domain-containing protein n=1 Tax=Streptomyces sparsogenes DSM 40356 TaxID=1331668 RepID=A0A1R1SK55_9ACTN|nr:hypothetical protein [Streptomyces sparsogenes]OMI38691.1 hypothetical protein SPAR_14743 [Streptomyces sparsogenes DSM 40356]
MLNRSPRTPAAALLCAAGLALLATGCEEDTAAAQPGRGPGPAASRGRALDGDSKGDGALALGKAAAITYKRGSDNVRGTLKIVAKSVVRGSQADLPKNALRAADRRLRPYYVTMTFTNVGDAAIHYPFLNTPTGLEDRVGVPQEVLITADEGVKRCPGKDPDDFGAGRTVTLCKIFLLPRGTAPATVTYATGDHTERPVAWKLPG